MQIVKVRKTTLRAPLSSADTQIVLEELVDHKGNALEMTAFDDFFVVVVRQGQSVEMILCDGITQNSDGSAILDIATNGRDLSAVLPYTGTTTGEDFSSGAEVVNGDDPYTIYHITKLYSNALAIAGVPNASETVKGGVEESTTEEVNTDVATGQTGAKLFITPTKLAASKYGLQLPSASEKEAIAGGGGFGAPSSANKFVTEDYLAFQGGFGDGADGDVTISTPTTLTRDMYYNNLTVNSTLTTDGYIIYVKNKIDGSGTIKHSAPTNGSNATAPAAGSYECGGGGGGAGGSGGIVAIFAGTWAGTFTIESVGGNGGNGYNGGYGAYQIPSLGGAGGAQRGAGSLKGGAGGAGGNSSTAGGSGVSANPALVAINGAPGGSGGDKWTNNYPAGGDGGVATVALYKPDKLKFLAPKLLAIKSDYTIAPVLVVPSGGGGGGGGADNNDNDAGGGGGGAGGNGGIAFVVYKKKTWTGSTVLNGGNGGIKGTEIGSSYAAHDGTAGNAGTLVECEYNELL